MKYIFVFILFLTSNAFADLKALEQQATIRVYVAEAPGMGHQSASVVVMRRLRQLGFTGTFEVIYADATAEKLKTLLPGFQAGHPDWQEVPSLKLRAISESQFKILASLPQVELAISGADDNRKNMNPQKLYAENYILMEPLGWGDSFHFSDQSVRAIPGLGGLGFHYEIDDSAVALAKEFKSMESMPDHVDKVPGLKSLMSLDAAMGAIYGVGLIPNFAEKIKIWVQGLQMAERALKFKKPLVLPIISPLNDYEMKVLKWELAMLEQSQTGAKPKRILLMDVRDPGLPQVTQELRPGDVLLVQTGRVPQPIFDAIFKRSDLPVLVAGKNAMNLSQNLGKVYINTVKDYGFKMGGDDVTTEKMIRDAFETFDDSKNFDRYIRQLSKFIQASQDPHSSLRQHFFKLGPQGRDKVAEALSFAGMPGLTRPESSVRLSCRQIF